MNLLMALSLVVSFVFILAVVFQIVKVGSPLFFLLTAILSPLLALAGYQAITGLASSFSMDWLILIVLVVVVSMLVVNRLRQ